MMFFLKPVNISSVNRFRTFVVASLVSFWVTAASFFLAPIWAFLGLFVVHVVCVYLAVTDGYTLLAFLLVPKDQREGEGDDAGH